MSDILFTMEDGSQALMHYGVMGMRWGVRHDKERTAQKVSSYLEKNRSKAQALREKAVRKDTTLLGGSKTYKRNKYLAKAEKYERKANRSQWNPLQNPIRRATNQRKAMKYRNKAAGYANSVAKISKLNAKAAKLDYKADKMERAYKKSLAKLERKEIKRGQRAMQAALA